MSRMQTIVQLDDHLVALLDERAASRGTSRSALIRAAIERYLADDIAWSIDAAIVVGYTRIPPDKDVLAEALAITSIEAEPW